MTTLNDKRANQPPEAPKVVYLLLRLNLNETALLGVRKKVVGQLKAFEGAGFETTLIDTPVANEPVPYWNNFVSLLRWPLDTAKRLRRNINNARGVLRRIRGMGELVIYIRHTRMSPGLIVFYGALHRLANVRRIYLEIPTWPFRYEGDTKVLELALWPVAGFCIQRVVTFSPSTDILGVETINITNGVSAEDNPLIPLLERASPVLKMVYVGQLYEWAGLDRMLRGIACYIGSGASVGGVQLHVAGEGRILENLKTLAAELGVDQYVTFHGARVGQELESVYSGAIVAIGNLANFRRKLSVNADLKNREYCMRGLPFVTGSSDLAFPQSFAFQLRVPSDESVVDVSEIVRFADSLRCNVPNYSELMRDFALKNLQWKSTLQPVIEDIRTALGRSIPAN